MPIRLRAESRADVKPEKRLVVVEGSGSEPRLGRRCQPLVEELVEGNGRRARRAIQIPLLELEIEEALRLAKRAVDGLVQVFARPGFGVAPLIDADKPGALSARNNLPEFAGHGSPPAREWGTQPAHTGAGEIRFYRGLRGVLLILRVSGRGRRYSLEALGVRKLRRLPTLGVQGQPDRMSGPELISRYSLRIRDPPSRAIGGDNVL